MCALKSWCSLKGMLVIQICKFICFLATRGVALPLCEGVQAPLEASHSQALLLVFWSILLGMCYGTRSVTG